jgi:hypothetical protein
LAIDANGGEVLEGLREFGLCFGFRTYAFASHAFALVAYSCMVEYIEETPSLVIYAMKFKFITRAYIMGEFALYILVLLTSHAFVVFDVSATGLFTKFII